MVKMNVTWR